jgi:hypothetical protein
MIGHSGTKTTHPKLPNITCTTTAKPHGIRIGKGSILFLQNGLKNLQKKTIKIITAVIIMRYIQL